MNRRALGLLSALAVAGIGASLLSGNESVTVGLRSPETKGDERPLAGEKRTTNPERLGGVAGDGSPIYVREVLVDGGCSATGCVDVLELRTTTPQCVRRPRGGSDCRRRLPDGGVVDQGALLRFPLAEAVGADCQSVACAVLLGDDPDLDDERDVLEREGGK